MTRSEKKLICETKITVDCFESPSFSYDSFAEESFYNEMIIEMLLDTWNYHGVIETCEKLRNYYNETKDERIFEELIRLLPKSYKVVKL